MAHLALQPGSRAEKLVQQQQQAGRSGGFAWLLGRKSRTAHDAAQLAARAFGGEQQRELTAETAQSMPRGWSGPSSPATAWNATELWQTRGMEENEDEETGEAVVEEEEHGLVPARHKAGRRSDRENREEDEEHRRR